MDTLTRLTMLHDIWTSNANAAFTDEEDRDKYMIINMRSVVNMDRKKLGKEELPSFGHTHFYTPEFCAYLIEDKP